MDDELAVCLRAWRDRLGPADVGLPVCGRRRAPGLRREEVAQLAGLSPDYLARLEQGRATHPSSSVLAPLARALRLTDGERAHLYSVAGQVPPGDGTIERHIAPSVQRVLDRLTDVPVIVLDAGWQILAANPLAVALLGDGSALPPRERNVLWNLFTGRKSLFLRTPQETEAFETEAVADLRTALGRYPHDTRLRALVSDLRRESDRFAALWAEPRVPVKHGSRKTLLHPQVGRITLDCDVMTVQGSELRLVVYTATPGSADADALALLAAIGLQEFAATP